MKNPRQPDDELPSLLRQYVSYLNAERPLPETVSQRLKIARMAALARFAAKKNQSAWGQEVLSWVSFGHPKMFAMASFVVCMAIGLVAMQAQQPDDAMLLGADLPLEAFADNGFAAWHDAEQI